MHCARRVLFKNHRSSLEVQNTNTTQPKLLYAYIILCCVCMFSHTQKTLVIITICLLRLLCMHIHNTMLIVFVSRMIKMFVAALIGGKGGEKTIVVSYWTLANRQAPTAINHDRRLRRVSRASSSAIVYFQNLDFQTPSNNRIRAQSRMGKKQGMPV